MRKMYRENLLWVFLTFLLAPYFYLRIWFCKRSGNKKDRPRILVIQTGKIGDLVCATLIFREIKKRHPLSFLTVLVSLDSKDIITNNPYIDRIITFNQKKFGFKEKLEIIRIIKKEKFDWSIGCLHDMINTIIPFWSAIPNRISGVSPYDTKSTKILSVFNGHNLEYTERTSSFNQYLEMLRFLDIKTTNRKMDIFVSKASEKKAEEFFKSSHISEKDFLIGICPTTGNRLKEWEPEKWAGLADRLIDSKGVKIVFIAGPNERDKRIVSEIQQKMERKSVNSAGLFALDEIAGLLKKLTICISSSSGPMHIADALMIPIVLIAGPCDLYSQPPIGSKSVIVWQPLYCYPCTSIPKTTRYCREGHHRCIKETTVEEVYQTAIKVIDKE